MFAVYGIDDNRSVRLRRARERCRSGQPLNHLFFLMGGVLTGLRIWRQWKFHTFAKIFRADPTRRLQN